MPGMLGSLDMKKFLGRTVPQPNKINFKGGRSMLLSAWNLWLIQIYGFCMQHLDFHQQIGEICTIWVNNQWRSWQKWSWCHCWRASIHKLFYLVDRIYSCSTKLLGMVSDPITMDFSFAIDQELSRKNVEWGYGVLKLKFQILSNLSNLLPLRWNILCFYGYNLDA